MVEKEGSCIPETLSFLGAGKDMKVEEREFEGKSQMADLHNSVDVREEEALMCSALALWSLMQGGEMLSKTSSLIYGFGA